MLYALAFAIMLLYALAPVPAEVIAISNAVIFSPVAAFMVTWFTAALSAQIG